MFEHLKLSQLANNADIIPPSQHCLVQENISNNNEMRKEEMLMLDIWK